MLGHMWLPEDPSITLARNEELEHELDDIHEEMLYEEAIHEIDMCENQYGYLDEEF